MTPKEIRSVTLDPRDQTADADPSNNSFPRRPVRTRFQLFKEERKPNPMQLLERKQPADQQQPAATPTPTPTPRPNE
jgi:hypothetical protein